MHFQLFKNRNSFNLFENVMIALRFAPRETFEIVSLWYQSGGHELSMTCKNEYFPYAEMKLSLLALFLQHTETSKIRASWYRNMVPSAGAFSTWDYEGDIYAQTPRILRKTHILMSRYLHVVFTCKKRKQAYILLHTLKESIFDRAYHCAVVLSIK